LSSKNGIIEWSEYVLSGLKIELEKIDKLLDYQYLSRNILLRALSYSKESRQINDVEFQILQISINKQVFQSSDLKELFVGKHSAEISRNIKRLRDKNLITSEKENSRKYLINFQNKILLRGIIRALDDNGFLPIMNE
jgi:Fic family protein